MEQHRFDLHIHSNRSDGADTPETVVENAKRNNLSMMALTDHDTVDGVDEACVTGERAGITVLPAIEMDTEWTSEMHILGLDLDMHSETLCVALKKAKQRRIDRNQIIFEKLKTAGYDVAPHMQRTIGSVTKLHIALALIDAGYATDIEDAFRRYLRKGCPGYCVVPRFTPEEVVSVIGSASGIPVWAHPFHGGGNVHAEWEMLSSAGIMGIEAYHPSSSEGQSDVLVSLAQQKNLLVTCGSDSHGAHRAGVMLGCTWRKNRVLEETYQFFMIRHQ